MKMSVITKSAGSVRHSLIPSEPSAARITLWPADFRICSIIPRTLRSSSITKMFAMFRVPIIEVFACERLSDQAEHGAKGTIRLFDSNASYVWVWAITRGGFPRLCGLKGFRYTTCGTEKRGGMLSGKLLIPPLSEVMGESG